MVLSSMLVASNLRACALRCSSRSLAHQQLRNGSRHSLARSFSLISQSSHTTRNFPSPSFVRTSRAFTIPTFWTKTAVDTPKESVPATATDTATAADTATATDAATTTATDAATTTNAVTATDPVTETTAAATLNASEGATGGIVDDAVAEPAFTLVEQQVIPAALQYGDLAAMGLASWTPAGLVQWSMELINVSTGLPWFYTIIAGSLFWRILMVPVSIRGLQNSAKLLPLQPKILAYQTEMEKIRKSGDKLALQKQALKMRKMYKDAGVSLGASAFVPFIQIPVTLGIFIGVRRMCTDVPQLMYSGVSFFPDLSVADPHMLLPVLLCAAVNLQISVGASEINLKERPEMGHIMNGLRILSLLGVWIMSSFPSGLMVSLLTTSAATTLQSLAFQYAPIRQALGIPITPPELRGRLPSPKETADYVIDYYKKNFAVAAQQVQQQQQQPKKVTQKVRRQ